jgi:hypothetical protein
VYRKPKNSRAALQWCVAMAIFLGPSCAAVGAADRASTRGTDLAKPEIVLVHHALNPDLLRFYATQIGFTEENAVGASNWLLMFCTSGPSFSVSVRVAFHSGSARNAPQRFSRSAMVSQA